MVEWVVRTHFFEIAKRLRHSFPRKHEEVVLPCKYRPSQTVFPNLTNWGDKRGPFCDPTQTCLTVLASHKAFDAFHFQFELPRSSMISRKGTMPMFRCAFPTQYQARQFGRLAMIPKSLKKAPPTTFCRCTSSQDTYQKLHLDSFMIDV